MAGNFKRGVPAYVGLGSSGNGLVPGRIQTSSPSGLYYTSNMKAALTTNQVEFLKNNKDNEYTWEEASGNKCIVGGVMVDETYYIGRVVMGDYSYLGRIDIGQRGLRYENSNGVEVLTNQYEVLTCTKKTCDKPADEEACQDKLSTCEQKTIGLNADIKDLNSKLYGCERLLNETQESNVLRNKLVESLGAQLKTCGSIQAAPSTTACPTSIPEVENEIPTTTQKKIILLEKEFAELKNKSATEAKKIIEQASRIATLESEKKELKISSQGVEGCINALQTITTLNQQDQAKLIKAMTEKLSPEDYAKINN